MTDNKPLTKKKIVMIITLFLLLLTSFRLFWINYHSAPEYRTAENGVIDLSDWKFTDKETLTLDGEWEFYPNQFLDPDAANGTEDNTFISVPGNWNSAFPNQKEEKASYGYGTYRLKLLLPKESQDTYALRMKNIISAATVFVNGEQLSEANRPSTSKKKEVQKKQPFITYLHTNENELDVMIHVSNFEHPFFGGIMDSIHIGTEAAINKKKEESISLQKVVFFIYTIHILYVIFLLMIGRGRELKPLLFYAIMASLAAFTNLIDDDMIIELPIPIEWYYKLLSFLFISTLISIVMLIKSMFHANTKLYRILIRMYALLSIIIVFIPFSFYFLINIGGMILYLTSFAYLFMQTFQIVKKGHPDALFILLFITSYTSNMIWGSLINSGLIEITFYPFDFIISIIVIGFLLLNRFIQAMKLIEKQAKELREADKKKDAFLANTSHELRNPLHGIINIAQTMLDDPLESLTKRNRENLNLLLQVGQQMRFTLNDILDVTRIKDLR